MQTENVLQQTFADIANVSGAFFEVFVVQLFERFRLTVDHGVGGSVGRSVIFLDQVDDFLLQLFVFQQHDVAFEDGCFLFTKRFTRFHSDRFQLLRSLSAAVEEAFYFLVNLVIRNLLAVDDDLILNQQQSFAESDTW